MLSAPLMSPTKWAKSDGSCEQGRCDSYVLMTNAGAVRQAHRGDRGPLQGRGREARRGFRFNVDLSADSRKQTPQDARAPRVRAGRSQPDPRRARLCSGARDPRVAPRGSCKGCRHRMRTGERLTALDKHGFVLLIGEPAAGKTTIASLLAMAALDQWHASMLKLDDPGKVVEHWNPEEPSQFFWLDDAFGVPNTKHFWSMAGTTSFPRSDHASKRGQDRDDIARLHLQPRAEGLERRRLSTSQGEPGRHRRSRPYGRREATDTLQSPQAWQAADRVSKPGQTAPGVSRSSRAFHS